MSAPNWNALLPSHEAIQAMSPEQLKAAGQAADQYVCTLANGISGLGHLLACTASNGETGLSEDAVTSVGWMLESLGDLISKLTDTGNGINLFTMLDLFAVRELQGDSMHQELEALIKGLDEDGELEEGIGDHALSLIEGLPLPR